MPGMHLKPEQVQRLCGVERALCQTVLDSLVDARFLRVSADGQYARVTRWRCGQSSFAASTTSESTRVLGPFDARGQKRHDRRITR